MASMSGQRKNTCFLETFYYGKKKFECQLCNRVVNSKRSVLKHLFQQHGLSPVQPTKKIYMFNENTAIPRSTLYRWKASKCRKSLTFGGVKDSLTVQEPGSSDEVIGHLGPDSSNNVQDPVSICSELSNDLLDNSDVSSSLCGSSLENSSDDSEQNSIFSTDTSSIFSAKSSDSDESDSDIEKQSENNKALSLLSCFKKHNLTSSACTDILRTIREILPEVKSNPLLNYKKVLSYAPSSTYTEVLYCSKCEYIFPTLNEQTFQCESRNCDGMVKSFMLADVKELLKSLLKSPGIMEDIKKNKRIVAENVSSEILTDIYDGELYRKQTECLNLSEETIMLTGILNTDGVNLYSSSKVELWPVFLAINELSPVLRFSRENILLVGLWQGKGKPSFKALMKCISEEINSITVNGLEVQLDGYVQNVTLSVIGVTLDLPAKAGVLNMTLYNGAEACITCEEPGKTVSQGRGHSRCYPHRLVESRFPIRSSANVLQLMHAATNQNRQKGFKGLSGLAYLLNFDLVYGTPPDYMHCVLLGVVKTLMNKWFSPVESGKEYFVGKHLKQISERFLKIKPPHYIERLPRDLQSNYTHFKATELQAFLLFYAVPCLYGILDEKFLQHFALLSEAIHILLGENISSYNLDRSEFLLDQFYSQFAALYGEGSCGLNVHNACVHMPLYVRKLGPLWAWSCFAFEDANSMILQSVHGTGDVVKQALRKQEIATYIRSSNEINTSFQKKLKVTLKAQNCDVLGSIHHIENNLSSSMRESLRVESSAELQKVLRVFLNGEKFYSAEYSRMKRRNCHCVLYSGDNIGLLQYFILVPNSNKVYAVLKKTITCVNSFLHTYVAAKHLQPVVRTNSLDVISVEHLKSTLMMIEVGNGHDLVVANMPNKFGRAILK